MVERRGRVSRTLGFEKWSDVSQFIWIAKPLDTSHIFYLVVSRVQSFSGALPVLALEGGAGER